MHVCRRIVPVLVQNDRRMDEAGSGVDASGMTRDVVHSFRAARPRALSHWHA